MYRSFSKYIIYYIFTTVVIRKLLQTYDIAKQKIKNSANHKDCETLIAADSAHDVE